MKYAIIDIGSNTIRLNLYHYDGSNIRPLMSKKTVAGLASYIREGYLTDRGLKKLINILDKYDKLIDTLDIDITYIFATAAIRNAENSEEIIKRIKSDLGLDVDLLSGKDEALYGYVGIRQDYSFDNGAIIDIGGGSTEISLLENKKIIFETSIKEGSLSLKTKFVSKILPRDKEINRMKRHMRRLIEKEDIPFDHPYDIYGVGGTIRSCGNISQEYYDLSSNSELNVGAIKKLEKKLYSKQDKALGIVLQVSPERIHTIIPGMIILGEIIKALKTEKVYISKKGVREGYLINKINGEERMDI